MEFALKPLSIALIAALALGCFDRYGWIFDLCVHWRILGIIGAVFLAAMAWFYGEKLWVGLLALTTLIICILIWLQHVPVMERTAHNSSLRVLSFNLWWENKKHDQVLEYLQNSGADVIVLVEGTPEWMEKLKPLQSIYPYSMTQPEIDYYHGLIFSKFPITMKKSVPMPGSPATLAELQTPHGPITVIGIHTPAPMRLQYFRMREKHITMLAALAQKQKNPVIITGDWNATPWSYTLRDFVKHSGLKLAASIPAANTWLLPIPGFGLPIDHIFASHHFQLRQTGIGPYLGSDHRAIWADFTAPKAN